MKGSRSKLLQSVLSPIAATVSIANIKASKPKLSVLQGLSRLIGLVAKLCRRFLHKVTFELGRSMLATAFHPVLPEAFKDSFGRNHMAIESQFFRCNPQGKGHELG
jgi:hypothetical protein